MCKVDAIIMKTRPKKGSLWEISRVRWFGVIKLQRSKVWVQGVTGIYNVIYADKITKNFEIFENVIYAGPFL